MENKEAEKTSEGVASNEVTQDTGRKMYHGEPSRCTGEGLNINKFPIPSVYPAESGPRQGSAGARTSMAFPTMVMAGPVLEVATVIG